jgi:hypothetical protein
VGAPEQFVLFVARRVIDAPLRLASNLAYELWCDGEMVGDGGHRSSAGAAPIDMWPQAVGARETIVRMHWIDPDRTVVYLRRAHTDPFLAVEHREDWTCHRDASLRTSATKACLQLPRQNIAAGPPRAGEPLVLADASTRERWELVDLGIARSVATEVVPRVIAERDGDGPPLPTPFDPMAHDDLAIDAMRWSQAGLPDGVRLTTYDLGAIGLHRVEVDTESGALLCISEVADFADVWGTPHRADVRLVDAIEPASLRAAAFGWRGGRYLHVLFAGRASPSIRVQRRDYPLRFREVQADDPRDEPLLAACRANLRACVDGGLVDTCWRERAQWAGDARMSAMALRVLADNPEVVALALDQIAQSYDPAIAMVSAVAPVSLARPCVIPGYHPAFCLAVAEHGVDALPRAAAVARSSLPRWRELYVRDGILDDAAFPAGMWWFVDWDPTLRSRTAVARPDDPSRLAGVDSVTHAWFHQACARFAIDSGIDVDALAHRYAAADGYRLHPTGADSPQATAALLLAFPDLPHRDRAIDWLVACHTRGELAGRVTPYFLTFVVQAIALRDRSLARSVLRDVLGPRIARWGTIPEKTDDSASCAHGWSVGFADLLLRE